MIAVADTSAVPVAPFTGAWIETRRIAFMNLMGYGSHPSRVRGLKPPISLLGAAIGNVAPFTGAWIETSKEEDEI